jgi:hypothetical protein
MLQPISEFFNGGLVTSRHAALLNPGELQRADNCVYRDKNPSIQRAPARTAYNATPLSAGVRGLAQLTFDQNTDQLIAWPTGNGTSSYLYKSDFTGLTGAFTIITGPGTIINCTTHSNTIVDGVAADAFLNMIIGTKVTGPGIPVGTYVQSVDSGTQIKLSQAATASATVTLVFDAGIPFVMSDTGNEILDIVQWQSTYFILPKVGPVTRMFWKAFSGASTDENLITRPAGLFPVVQFDATNISIQTGTSGQCWSSVLGSGYYWFLITEILSTDDPKLPSIESGYTIGIEKGESTKNARPQVVNIADYLVNFVRITFPTIVNDGTQGKNRATHWGIYMSFISSGKAAYQDPTNAPSLATFKRIMKVAIELATVDIRFNNVPRGPNLAGGTAAGPDAGLAQFTTPANMLNRGVGVSYGQSGPLTGGTAQEQALTTFGFTNSAPFNGYAVTGVEVTIVSSAGSIFGNQAGYYIWLDSGAGVNSSNRQFGVSDRTTMYAKTWGGQFETWGIVWTPTTIANLRVILLKSYSASNQLLQVDYIEVKVYYVGGASDSGSIDLDGPPYQVVTYRSQIGTTINDPANYIIPTASTGDVFQGSLVLNDVTSPSLIRYSLPNAPESFPKPYFIKFDSKNKDIVTYIRRIGQILIVGMRDSIKRINYLPTEVDTDFGRGIAHEDIVIDEGVVGPLAGTLFDIPGVGTVLGFISYNGFHITEGISVRPFNLDIDFKNLVKTEALSTSILRAYPKEKWLIFYYCPKGATHNRNTRAIIFHYQQDKIKEGGFLPATGPISVSAKSAVSAKLAGVPYMLTGHETTGFIYVEDNTDIQPSDYQVHDENDILISAPIVPSIITRKIYPSGYDKDTRQQRIYVLYNSLGVYSQLPSTITSGSSEVTSTGFFSLLLVGMRVRGEGISPGTIVTSVADPNTITISQPALSTGDVTLIFDDGTISIGVRGSGIYENVSLFNTRYFSTLTGDLLVSGQDNYKQGLELQIEKVYINEDVSVDLNQAMRLYNFTYLAEVAGTEMNRAS